MPPSCLNCNSALTPGQTHLGKFLECLSCNSRLVGFHLLHHLLPTEAADHLWVTAHRNSEADLRPCPLCLHGMAKTSLPDDPIVLDLCTRCHMVWFDSDEFSAEPFKMPPGDPVLKMRLEERKRFALEKIEFQKEMAQDDDPFPRPQNARELVFAVLRLPIEYDNPVVCRPVATWATALLIVAVSLLGFLDLETAAQTYGFIPEFAFRWGGVTFLTSFFIHGGFFHLAGNLYFLLIFGDNVEDRIGVLRWVVLLACATVVGNLASLLFESTASKAIPHIGASGGISALITFYALRFPGTKIGILFLFRILKIPALFLLVFWILMQVIGAMVQSSGVTMVGYMAHLGGALTGILFWLLWRKR